MSDDSTSKMSAEMLGDEKNIADIELSDVPPQNNDVSEKNVIKKNSSNFEDSHSSGRSSPIAASEKKSYKELIKQILPVVGQMIGCQLIAVGIGYGIAVYNWFVNMQYDTIEDCGVRLDQACLPEPQGHIQRSFVWMFFTTMCLYSYARFRCMVGYNANKWKYANISYALMLGAFVAVVNYALGSCTALANSWRLVAWALAHMIAWVNSYYIAKHLYARQGKASFDTDKNAPTFQATFLACLAPWIIWNVYSLAALNFVFRWYSLFVGNEIFQDIVTILVLPLTEFIVIQGVVYFAKLLNEWYDVESYMLAEGTIKSSAHIWRTMLSGLSSLKSVAAVSAITSCAEIFIRMTLVWRQEKLQRVCCMRKKEEIREQKRLRFWATIMIARMNSEYMAIFIANLVVYDVKVRIIQTDDISEAWSYFLGSLFIQFFFELAADIISCIFEERQGIYVVRTWFQIRHFIFFLFIFDLFWSAVSVVQPSYAVVYTNLCLGAGNCAPGEDECFRGNV